MIREAVEALGSPTTNVGVRDWIEERYPGTNHGTIQAQITISTVNKPSRVDFQQNRQPRLATDPRYDFLFSRDRGSLEWYRPERHGTWRIDRDDEGRLAISRDDGEFIYPSKEAKPQLKRKTVAKPQVKPVTQAQISAAKALHQRLPKWAATDRAFERLGKLFRWDLEDCILKTAAINDLYSTNVYAVWRMAEHLKDVMIDPPEDPARLVKEIASLPDEQGIVTRRHWSFASKVGHFFIAGDRFPIYDSFCREMIAHHLGGDCARDVKNPYRAFITNLERLRAASAPAVTLRELDRYLWLAGQYREFLDKRDEAQLNSELRPVFESRDPEIQLLLRQLWPHKPE